MKRLLQIAIIGLVLLVVLIISLLGINWIGLTDPVKLLVGHNYNSGDWLLVNVNYVEKTLQVIDDEEILEKNKNGIWVRNAGECGGTTCDGFLMLFKDGKLIVEDEYLSRSLLYESTEIKESYRSGIDWTIEPKNEKDFKQVWDSLRNTGCYPTVYHTQPDDKDIIWVYRIEEEK